jgi:hypothetical protein
MISCTIKNRRIRLLVMEMDKFELARSWYSGRSIFLFLLLADMVDNFYRQIN